MITHTKYNVGDAVFAYETISGVVKVMHGFVRKIQFTDITKGDPTPKVTYSIMGPAELDNVPEHRLCSTDEEICKAILSQIKLVGAKN